MRGHLVFLKLSRFLLIICPTLQICILCTSTAMTYYTSHFQMKCCSCWQICGPLGDSGIMRQWPGKFLCSPKRPLLGARAGQQGTKPDTLFPLNVYGKGGISLVAQPAAPEFLLGCWRAQELCLGTVVFSRLLSAGCWGRLSREELQILHLLLLFWPWHQHRDCIWRENCFSTLQLVT